MLFVWLISKKKREPFSYVFVILLILENEYLLDLATEMRWGGVSECVWERWRERDRETESERERERERERETERERERERERETERERERETERERERPRESKTDERHRIFNLKGKQFSPKFMTFKNFINLLLMFLKKKLTHVYECTDIHRELPVSEWSWLCWAIYKL